MSEPTTRAGVYLYHGIAVRGQEWKAADAITAIEAEAREQGAREERERLRRTWQDATAVMLHAEVVPFVDRLLSDPGRLDPAPPLADPEP